METLLSAALQYAIRGLHVVPVHGLRNGRCTCGDSDCASVGKHPRIKDWQTQATRSPEAIRQWWLRWPDANIGCALERSGLVVIDIDPRNGGDKSYAQLVRLYGAYETARSRTGDGGFHDFFIAPRGIAVKSRSAAFGSEYPGVDVKAAGGLVVLPPSLHRSGRIYEIVQPARVPILLPPAWAKALIVAQEQQPASNGVPLALPDRIPEGRRHDTFTRLLGLLRDRGFSRDEMLAASRVVNEQRCSPPMKDDEVVALVDDIALRYEPENDLFAGPIEWADARPWPTMAPAAYHGLAGEIVWAIDQHTEADPVGVLLTLLVAFGNAVGPRPHAAVGDDQHPGRLFAALVGGTSTGGKGTSLSAARPFLREADKEWWTAAYVNGFASGEAIIARLSGDHQSPADPIEKRAFVVEPEFGRLLTVNRRDGSTSSPVLRGAWDDGRLQLIRSQRSLLAEDTHVSILAHITPEELRAKLSTIEIAGGFANRFLFACVKRSKPLPSPRPIDPAVLQTLAKRLWVMIGAARPRGLMRRTPEAEVVWVELYRAEPERNGLVGEVTARWQAQKLRLSVAYALLDGATEIRPEHVIAAEAVWRYCVESAEHIFGCLRDVGVESRLLDALREAYPNVLTGAQQAALFGRNLPAGRLRAAREALVRDGLILRVHSESGEKRGRPEIIHVAVPPNARTNQDPKSRKTDVASFYSSSSAATSNVTTQGRDEERDPRKPPGSVVLDDQMTNRPRMHRHRGRRQ